MSSTHCPVPTGEKIDEQEPELTVRVLDPTKDDIGVPLEVREDVFAKEEQLLSGSDEDKYDRLRSARHLVAYVIGRPVGTIRLVLSDAQVANAMGGSLGIPFEEKQDLSALCRSGHMVAETGRVAVMKDYREKRYWARTYRTQQLQARPVIMHLLEALYWVSLQARVTVWVAGVNLQTDSVADALLMAQVAAARKLEGPWRISARACAAPPAVPSTLFYGEAEWERARLGQLGKLHLPPVLTLFTRKMGARVIGAPVFDPMFTRMAIPISAVLGEIPEGTLEQFEALDQDTHPAT